MLSPCGGCDPHLVSAVVCYLSFFCSGCSFFLYWYWLANYREEQNGCGTRYDGDADSECETLDVDNPEVAEHQIYPIKNEDSGGEEEHLAPSSEDLSGSISLPAHKLPSSTKLISIDNNSSSSGDSTQINTITRTSNENESEGKGVKERVPVMGTPTTTPPDNPLDDEHNSYCAAGEETGQDNNQLRGNSAVSDNPYLNGNTYSQNVLWGLHGIFTNLIEAILAAVFYSGLFENNMRTSVVWLIGFGTNFVVGNLLYLLLLVYFTNKVKMKELRVRWALESTFNILKDLYYFWVGAVLVNHIRTN